jgi:hypothetical protein
MFKSGNPIIKGVPFGCMRPTDLEPNLEKPGLGAQVLLRTAAAQCPLKQILAVSISRRRRN